MFSWVTGLQWYLSLSANGFRATQGETATRDSEMRIKCLMSLNVYQFALRYSMLKFR